jgi:aspartyl protease family protein
MNLRLLTWLALLLALVVGVSFLSRAFPGSLSSDFEVARLVWLFALIALISSGIVFSREARFGETVRNLGIWVAIAAILAFAFSFQDELRFAWGRVRAELVPGYPVETSLNAVELAEGLDGHFHVIGEANGQEVDFMVDTGAADTVLTPADAARLGIDLSQLEFSRFYETANGLGRGAPIRLESLAIGSIIYYDFPVTVNETNMGSSLLGMSFLRQLESFEVRDRRLILRP